MSLNVGGIYVATKRGVDVKRVRAAISAYYLARGAIKDPGKQNPGEPLALGSTGRLAFAVLPAADRWVCVADSERYTADFALAGSLATELATQVCWYALYGATDGGVIRMFGPGRKPKLPDDEYGAVEDFIAKRFANAFVYLDKLPAKAITDRFANVSGYDAGPVPTAETDEFVDAPAATVDWPIAIPRQLAAEGHLRFGMLVAFFVPGVFKRHVAAAAAVFEQWLKIVPDDALRSAIVGASSSTTRAFSPKTIASCRKQLTPAIAAKHSYFRLVGSDYGFEISGSVKDASDGKAGFTNDIQVAFPWSTPIAVITAFAQHAAELLAYSTGLVTPALMFDDSLVGDPGRPVAARLALRHPGLELGVDGFKLADKVHGAHWMTFLGPDQVVALGRTMIDRSGVTVIEAGKGLALRASPRPEVGDVLADQWPAGMREMAKLLAPISAAAPAFARQASPCSTIELEDGAASERFDPIYGARWSRRFLEDGRELALIAKGLDVLGRAEAADDRELLELITQVPYVSTALAERLIVIVGIAVAKDQRDVLARITSVYTATDLLVLANYRDRHEPLLASPKPQETIEWLFRNAVFANDRATAIASLGARFIAALPAVAPAVIAAFPAETTDYTWSALLRPINNQLGALCYEHTALAEQLCEAILPVAHHNAEMILWIATIYILRGRLDDAITQLERMFAAGYRDKSRLLGDKDFAPLYKNPRFVAL